jgi:hypothetical protein
LATGSKPFRGTAPTCGTAYAGNLFAYGGVNHVKSITQADSSAAPRRPSCLADPALREKHLATRKEGKWKTQILRSRSGCQGGWHHRR